MGPLALVLSYFTKSSQVTKLRKKQVFWGYCCYCFFLEAHWEVWGVVERESRRGKKIILAMNLWDLCLHAQLQGDSHWPYLSSHSRIFSVCGPFCCRGARRLQGHSNSFFCRACRTHSYHQVAHTHKPVERIKLDKWKKQTHTAKKESRNEVHRFKYLVHFPNLDHQVASSGVEDELRLDSGSRWKEISLYLCLCSVAQSCLTLWPYGL